MTNKIQFGQVGLIIGAIALLLALTHFWAGPFAPQPTLESTVAEKAVAIRNATLDALKGKKTSKPKRASWDADKLTHVATALLGGLAIIFGVFSWVKKESTRLATGAAALGISAIAFQFIAMYAMALLVVILIAAVLSNLGFG